MAAPLVDQEHSFVNAVFQTYGRFCPAVMRKLITAFLATLKSLMRKTSFLHRSFTTWYTRPVAARTIHSNSSSKSLDLFTEEVERLLGAVLDTEKLVCLSEGLQQQFKNALRSDMSCMLPSYNHQLPQGLECGTYLALDVGGSTFRVALIQLSGPQEDDDDGMKILSLKAFTINDSIKQLVGTAFFDWMAGRIKDTIYGHPSYLAMDGVLSMGLAWSFPIEQTSLRSGMMQVMGKGFMAAQGLLGQDLGDLIQEACSRKNLRVELHAIVNDSSATLLAKAYTNPSTRYGLILGTGVNIAVNFPVGAIQHQKFGIRPDSWHNEAEHVIVNTELGMFGRGILPMTRWDDALNANHILPDFQPLEHLVSGRYLGEVARLIISDGVRNVTLLNGSLPTSLEKPYSFDTETLARIQGSNTTQEARDIFSTKHPSSHLPSDADIRALRFIATNVSKRSSAIVAASIHALWELRRDFDSSTSSAIPSTSPSTTLHEYANGLTNGTGKGHLKKNRRIANIAVPVESVTESKPRSLVACNGSVIELYPSFRSNCQNYLDALMIRSGGEIGTLELAIASESSLRGAAVAVACLESSLDLDPNLHDMTSS